MKINNKDAGYYARNLIEFEGSNFYGEWENINDISIYAVYSYRTLMAVYIDGLWFKNCQRYTNTTSKQMFYLKNAISFDYEIQGGEYGEELRKELKNNLGFYRLTRDLPTHGQDKKKTKV